MTMAQRLQNKMLRILDRALVLNRKSTKTLLYDQNMLSVNQIAAQIKLTEMWKALNDPQYPIKMKTRERQENSMETRILRVTPFDQLLKHQLLKHQLLKHQLLKHQLSAPKHQLSKTSTVQNIKCLNHQLSKTGVANLFHKWAKILIKNVQGANF
jgi:hypothetical protein